ncbi:MAG TPA: 4-hydroxybenzoate octaprenyltransferase [Steroidobacteraceae bacterium]|nr:4-hydroxybenzoate octaprenyltransferase [Steroidobacteraceae bacterium]
MAESVDFELQAGATSVEAITSFTPDPPEPPTPPDSVPEPLRRWLRQAGDYARLMRLDRPIGIWLLLWPTLWALWTASLGHPHARLLAIFVAGAVLMRSAGCVINDLLDRDIDPHVRRTRDRPLAARRIAPFQALVLFVVLVALALLLVLQLNAATVRLSFIGAVLTLSYPLLKRFFPLPQLYLGLSFGWAVPMAFAAELGAVPRVGWVMMLATVVWAGVYDTFYAMADRADDLRVGVKSSAITFGDLDLLMVGAMQAMVLLALLFTGRLLELGSAYYTALAVGAGCFIRQQWLARNRDAPGCMRAFHDNHYFGVVVLAGIIVDFAQR